MRNISNESDLSLIFKYIYDTNFWGNGSGLGSFKECTDKFRLFLKKFIDKYRIKKFIDLGCGDWQMMRNFNFSSGVYYYGYDVVEYIVKKHNSTYGKANIHFYYLNSIEDRIEKGDLIMIKDVLQHLENKYVKYFLDKILPNYKYGIIVNDYKKNAKNIEIKIGKWRPLNLEISPFFYKQFTYHQDMMFCSDYKRIYIKS